MALPQARGPGRRERLRAPPGDPGGLIAVAPGTILERSGHRVRALAAAHEVPTVLFDVPGSWATTTRRPRNWPRCWPGLVADGDSVTARCAAVAPGA